MQKPNYKKLMAKWKRRRKRIVFLMDVKELTSTEVARAIQEKGKPPISRQQVEKLYKAEKAKQSD